METPLDYRVFMLLSPIMIVLEVIVLYRLYRLWNHFHAKLMWRILFLGFLWLTVDFFRVSIDDCDLIYYLKAGANILVFFIPPAWFLVSFSYHKKQNYYSKSLAWSLNFLPIIMTLVLLTNEFHRLYWIDYDFIRLGAVTRMETINGPLFWVNVVYGFALVFASLVLYISSLKSTKNADSIKEKWLIMIALLIPTLSELIFLLDFISSWNKDMVPVFFGITTLLLHEAFLPSYKNSLSNREYTLSSQLS